VPDHEGNTTTKTRRVPRAVVISFELLVIVALISATELGRPLIDVARTLVLICGNVVIGRILVALFLIPIAFAVAMLWPEWASRCWRRVLWLGQWLGSRRALAVVTAGVVTAGGSIIATEALGVPQPNIHDEFCYLLQADTFASGRVTNPTHPMWHHFETMHVFFEPTYNAKYPPAQGLALALGKWLTGRPVVGLWVSMGLMGAAMCWMLLTWLPPRWAMLGTALAAFQLGFGEWGHSFWGGAMAAAGGAILLGSLRTVLTLGRMRDALLLGLGVAVLANSRPFEGALMCLPVAAALWIGMFASKVRQSSKVYLRVILPVAIVLGLTGAAMAFYNWRVTESPWRLPYMEYESQYSSVPHFAWQAMEPLENYRHRELNVFFNEVQPATFASYSQWTSFIQISIAKLLSLDSFYLGIDLLVPFLVGVACVRSRWTRFAAGTVAILLAGLAAETYSEAHYVAPGTCLVILISVCGLRKMRRWRIGDRRVGQAIVPALVFAGVMAPVLVVGARWATADLVPRDWSRHRAAILQELESSGSQHLVVVRYEPSHNVHEEWVYNAADIDAASVVWAREMSTEENAALFEYFDDRTAWVLEADASPPRLSSYSPPSVPRDDSGPSKSLSPQLGDEPNPSVLEEREPLP